VHISIALFPWKQS